MQTKVSYYRNITDTASQVQVPLVGLLSNIQNARWQDEVLDYRNTKNPDKKKKLPNFTVSGIFKQRKANALQTHSGFIALDFDDLAPDVRDTFNNDPYTFAAFQSVGGYGFCVIVKIKPSMHTESWNQLANYYRSNYGLFVDPSGKDVSRTRFISYDPDLFMNDQSKTFIAKREKKQKRTRELATTDDTTRLIKAIVDAGIDITTEYSDWIGLGFFLSETYGDAGLEYFHQLSQFHPKYDIQQVEKKWQTFKNGSQTGSRWNAGSLFYLAKQAGIEIDRSRTKEVVQVMKVAKKSKSNVDAVREALKIEGKENLSPEEEDLWDKVNPDEKEKDESDLLKAATYLKINKDIYINAITRAPYVNGEKVNDYLLNSLVLECNQAGFKVTPNHIAGIINSNKFPTRDPLREYFQDIQCKGPDAIDQVIDALNAKEPELARIFLKYWFVGIMQTLYDYPVPYCPVLIGSHGNGKTYWVRNLMTDKLLTYYAEKNLENNNDDRIMMSEILIILNDEYDGMAKKQINVFKQILSSTKFNLRRAYGRYNDEYKRIASVIATSNEDTVLFDYTGNRRIFPIPIESKINFKLYNAVNKERLWGQIYNLWVNKDWPVDMSDEHLDILKGKFDEHYEADGYEPILTELLDKPEGPEDFTSNYELQKLMQQEVKGEVNAIRLGHAMTKLGYKKKIKKQNGKTVRGYMCKLNEYSNLQISVNQ